MYLPLVIDITKQFTFHNTIKSYLYNPLKQIKTVYILQLGCYYSTINRLITIAISDYILNKNL